jgi:hypothetical protein
LKENSEFRGIPFSDGLKTEEEYVLKKSAKLKVTCYETVKKDLYGDIRLNTKGETISLQNCDSNYYLLPTEHTEWQVTEKLVSLKDDWELDEISLYYYFKHQNSTIKIRVFSMGRGAFLKLPGPLTSTHFFDLKTLKSQIICKKIDRFEKLNAFEFVTIKQPSNPIQYEILEKDQLGFLKKASADQSMLHFLNDTQRSNTNLLYTESNDFNFELSYLATVVKTQNEVLFKEALGYYWVPEGELYSEYTSTIAIKETRGGEGDFTRKMVYHPTKLSELVEIRLKKEFVWDVSTEKYQYKSVAFCPVFQRNFEETTLQTKHLWYSISKISQQLGSSQPYWFKLLMNRTIQGLIYGQYKFQE